MDDLVSIIMPVYNAGQFIKEAIQSVLDQSYPHWELLIVNDGSTDTSEKVIKSFDDSRIRYFAQNNQGVSAARNVGLSRMTGDYFCFLDADDVMTKVSLTSRLDKFSRNSKTQFVQGGQVQVNEKLEELSTQIPDFVGNPRKGLIRIDPGCFINCGTWLIKNNRNRKYQFETGLTHSEDLVFFLSISNQGLLDVVEVPVQLYRRIDSSAMANLDGLRNGYRYFYRYARDNGYIKSFMEMVYLQARIRRVMTLSYLANGQFWKAFISFIMI